MKKMFDILVVCVLFFVIMFRKNPRKTILDAYNTIVRRKYPNLPDSEEVSERMAIIDHLRPGRVLEIGGNVGGVSSLIHAMGNDLVVVEPSKYSCAHLRTLVPHVFEGVVRGEGDKLLQCETKSLGEYCVCKESNHPTTKNATIADLEAKFGKFQSVVIDCEGCYTSLLPDILGSASIKQIQIEWDGPFLEEAILRSGYVLSGAYEHVNVEYGVRVYDKVR
jgi:hypothetical protein